MKKTAKRFILIIAIIVLLILPALFLREYIVNYFVKVQLVDITDTYKDTRLLVFAPHNDDEILGAGGLINKTIKSGGTVEIVMMTNGDGFKGGAELDYRKLNLKPADYIHFGYQRQKETLTALSKLGVDKRNVIFLGYPDGGVSQLWENYWNISNRYYDHFTQVNYSPYNNSFTDKAAYCGENVVSDIIKIIGDFKPDYIVCPDTNDAHPDHWATYNFVKYSETLMKYEPKKEWLYLVHQQQWPAPMKKRPLMYLVPPAQLIGGDTNWVSLPLDRQEVSQKEQSINEYKSQTIILRKTLFSFIRKNELFGELPSFKLNKEPDSSKYFSLDIKNKVISVPAQYYLPVQIDRSGAFGAVYTTLAEDGKINIGIAMKGNVQEDMTYHLNMILFSSTQVLDLKLKILGGKVNELNIAGQPIQNIGQVELSQNRNFLYISIPAQSAAPLEHIFINVLTSQGAFNIDRTAWRMIDIQN